MKRLYSLILSFVLALVPAMAQQHKITSNITPQGTPQWYSMDAYVQTSQGTVMFYGLSNQISFAPDGRSVYFKTLFPMQYGELWVKGTIDGNTITINSNEVVGRESFTDEGTRYTYDLKVGEPIFDIMDNIIGVKDVVFKFDGERIYIEDDQKNPDHAIALYGEEDGEIDLFDWTFCDSFKPYTGPTEEVAPPATADVKSYVYDYKDSHLNAATTIARVAVDGNDYYFENLVPSIGGWTKGVRNGNTISVSRAQLLKFEPQILKIAGYRQSDGGRLSDFSFSIDDKGVITQADGDNQFIVCYQTNGSLLDYGRSFKLTPYDDSKALMPLAPYEVHSVYYSELNQHGIEFYQVAYDTDGNKLAPDQLGYYIYVNGERFTFTKEQYPYLSWNSTEFIPYGYCDDYNYGDIFNDGVYNVVLFYIDDYETLGVQSVYRSSNVETRSGIITVDKSNMVDELPDGVGNVQASPVNARPTWYDLNGRQLNGEPTHGVFLVDGRKVIVK